MFRSHSFIAIASLFMLVTYSEAQENRRQPPESPPPFDAVEEAQQPAKMPGAEEGAKPSEQARPPADQSAAKPAMPITAALNDQRDGGKLTGFDFSLDPLNAKRPRQTFEEIMAADVEAKPSVMELQRKLLESRYNLTPTLDPEAAMSRGKRLVVGPTGGAVCFELH